MRFSCCIGAALSLALLCGCASSRKKEELPPDRLLEVEGVKQMGSAYEGGKPLTPISAPAHPPLND
ncbi:MAG: hypothetical protein V1746_05815 [bacterium]